MNEFLFSADDLVFRLPWTKPDFFRLKLWYRNLGTSPASKILKPFLFGNFWSSGKQDAQSIQVCFETIEDWKNVSLDQWSQIHSELVTKFISSINEYRMLVELFILPPNSIMHACEVINSCEVNKDLAVSINDFPPQLDVFGHYKMVQNGSLAFEYFQTAEPKLTGGHVGFYNRNSVQFLEMARCATNGRVFLPPTSLFELFRSVETL